MKIKDIEKQAKKLSTKIMLGALIGCTIGGLSGCSAPTNSASNNSSSTSFVKDSKSKQEAIINQEELSYLKRRGDLLAMQADKKVQHINATKHQRYPIPYTRSSDGHYWSWYKDHYVPKSVVHQVLLANRSDASDKNFSDSDAEASYDANRLDNELQANLMKHNVSYGINFTILEGSTSNALDVYQSSDTTSKMPVKYYSTNTYLQKWATKRERNYLEEVGNAKAKKADKKIENLNKDHHQKYPIPYVKSDDGNYWSWYQKHSIPKSVIDKFEHIEKHHDSDYDLSSDSGYITHRFDNDVQFGLMKHGVNYGVNYNRLSSQIMNKYNEYEND